MHGWAWTRESDSGHMDKPPLPEGGGLALVGSSRRGPTSRFSIEIGNWAGGMAIEATRPNRSRSREGGPQASGIAWFICLKGCSERNWKHDTEGPQFMRDFAWIVSAHVGFSICQYTYMSIAMPKIQKSESRIAHLSDITFPTAELLAERPPEG